ncbi:MAG: thiolase protein [Gammaproteobacteria bacterium]|jgi:acetyl-CoA C-acetyltransferase|nr:thiolase protein [Gammaproteobacteria bacterium]
MTTSSAIVGVGEVPTGKYPLRTELEAAVTACRAAMLDAGLGPKDIEVVMPVGVVMGSRHFNADLIFSRICEELGMLRSAKLNVQVMAGGASGSATLKVAAALVASGSARTVLVVHSDAFGSSAMQEGIDLFATLGICEEWEAPYGHNANAAIALLTRRYMHETGTTEEELASVAVALRSWGELNPNAMFRKPLTVDEVEAGEYVATPLRPKTMSLWADGASAYIVAKATDARSITRTPVYIRGAASLVTHYSISQDTELALLAFPQVAKEAYARAGLTPKDIHIAELYDAYAVVPLLAMDALNLCGGERAGTFVAAGHTQPGGRMPMTTNGGGLSLGHTGAGVGVALVVEAARQLMGKAGARQVPNAVNAVETGSGGTWMDSHVTVLSRESR